MYLITTWSASPWKYEQLMSRVAADCVCVWERKSLGGQTAMWRKVARGLNKSLQWETNKWCKEMTNPAWEVSLSPIVGPEATRAQGCHKVTPSTSHSVLRGLSECSCDSFPKQVEETGVALPHYPHWGASEWGPKPGQTELLSGLQIRMWLHDAASRC